MKASAAIVIRVVLLLCVAAVFLEAWRRLNRVEILVLGQPESVGRLQAEQEAPFFHSLAERSGLPLKVTYTPANVFGLKDTYQLEALRQNRIDLVSLRFMQNGAVAPALQGIDLPGMVSSSAMAQQVSAAYRPWLNQQLQQTYGARLLGIWSIGPQILFCRDEFSSLRDLKGRRVRVASQPLGQIVSELGGSPIVLPFEDTQAALKEHIVDCAFTSAASAIGANWIDHTHYYYPMPFQFGMNGYAISSSAWDDLSISQQKTLSQTVSTFNAGLWQYSEMVRQQSERCLETGQCGHSKRRPLIRVQPRDEDFQRVRMISRRHVIPAWLNRCETIHPGCRRAWAARIEPLLNGVKDSSNTP